MIGLSVVVLLTYAVTPSADEVGVVAAANAERTTAGAMPLSLSLPLLVAARGHAVNMARQNTLSHELDGKGMADRLKELGYTYRMAGENVSAGYADPAAAVAGWMKSEPHKANLLNADFTQIGTAVATAVDGKRYWVQVFGTPPE